MVVKPKRKENLTLTNDSYRSGMQSEVTRNRSTERRVSRSKSPWFKSLERDAPSNYKLYTVWNAIPPDRKSIVRTLRFLPTVKPKVLRKLSYERDNYRGSRDFHPFASGIRDFKSFDRRSIIIKETIRLSKSIEVKRVDASNFRKINKLLSPVSSKCHHLLRTSWHSCVTVITNVTGNPSKSFLVRRYFACLRAVTLHSVRYPAR